MAERAVSPGWDQVGVENIRLAQWMVPSPAREPRDQPASHSPGEPETRGAKENMIIPFGVKGTFELWDE